MSRAGRGTRRSWIAQRSVSWSLCAGLLVTGVARAAPPETADNGGGDVAALRVEVDELAQKLEGARADVRDDLSALRAERAELERRVRLARVRRKTLEELQTRQTERDATVRAEAARWIEPARAAVAITRAYVARSLPFARAERLAAVDRIGAELDRAEPDVGRAMQRLWRLLEEEAAMTTEVSLSRQPVTLEGEAQLADVLRLGMAVMYVRTVEGQIAWAVPDASSAAAWRLELVRDPALEDTIWALFDAQERNRGFGPVTLAVPAGSLELATKGRVAEGGERHGH